MSILIKGMQMPKNCAECPVALSGKYCLINQTYTTYIKLPARPEHCPLVELPEHHGDLVDVDAVWDGDGTGQLWFNTVLADENGKEQDIRFHIFRLRFDDPLMSIESVDNKLYEIEMVN